MQSVGKRWITAGLTDYQDLYKWIGGLISVMR